jgi:type II secretory pathway pseudopilin PulG
MWQVRARTGSDSRERGDTIVEVLIAIVIVATVIGGAYVVSNKSLQSTRGAQERSTALKLAEAQIEQLKSVVANNPTAIFGASAPTRFCLASDAAGTTVYNKAIAAQAARCRMNANSAQVAAGVEPAWTFEITRTGNTFVLRETWQDISGDFNNSLQLNYRAYQP